MEYNNLGVYQLRLGKIPEGIHNLQVANAEDFLTTGGGSSLARQNLLDTLTSWVVEWFYLVRAIARAFKVQRINEVRLHGILESLDINGLATLALPLWAARYSWDAASVGRMERMKALAGLTTFLEQDLRRAAASTRARSQGVSQSANTLGGLINTLGKHTQRPWWLVYSQAKSGLNPAQTKALTSASTAKDARAAMTTIRQATGPGAGRGRFAARCYLTALLVRNFSHHTLEHTWNALDDRGDRWLRTVGWVLATIFQCDIDFGRDYLGRS